MQHALKRILRVPKYLLRMTVVYLKDRVSKYHMADGTRPKKIMAETLQDSVLESDLWNMIYDGIFEMKLLSDASKVGYADDKCRDLEPGRRTANGGSSHVNGGRMAE